jgi:hypothetical protein
VFPWLSMPKGRMGPPLRSFAADAYDCIMVRVLGPTGYKVVARLIRARKRAPPLIVIPIAPSVPSCSKLSRYGLASSEHAARLGRRPTLTAPARDDVSEPRVGTKKRALRSNKETDEGQTICRRGELLDKKSSIQGNCGTLGKAARPAAPQRAHGLVGHGMLLSWMIGCEPLISGRDVPLRHHVGCAARRSALPRERFSPLTHLGSLL